MDVTNTCCSKDKYALSFPSFSAVFIHTFMLDGDVVVEEYDGKVDVAARAVDEVVAADGCAVAVACDDDDVELGVGELDTRCERDGTAVCRMHGIEVHVARRARRAADTRYDDCFVLVEVLFFDRLYDGFHNSTVTAAGAPDVREAVHTKIFFIASHLTPPPRSYH